jgi:hypothetical protein
MKDFIVEKFRVQGFFQIKHLSGAFFGIFLALICVGALLKTLNPPFED